MYVLQLIHRLRSHQLRLHQVAAAVHGGLTSHSAAGNISTYSDVHSVHSALNWRRRVILKLHQVTQKSSPLAGLSSDRRPSPCRYNHLNAGVDIASRRYNTVNRISYRRQTQFRRLPLASWHGSILGSLYRRRCNALSARVRRLADNGNGVWKPQCTRCNRFKLCHRDSGQQRCIYTYGRIYEPYQCFAYRSEKFTRPGTHFCSWLLLMLIRFQ